jgi:EAL domain-containing protein (putative c-di-GMP-specific phosphodiesterase class I)
MLQRSLATAPALEILHRLRDIGVRIALDDFGTG